jgi:hypothetical protein
MRTTLKTIEPHRRFPYDGVMNKQLDHKAWKAARKAGLIAHKVQGIKRGQDDLFVCFAQTEDGHLKQIRGLFTAEEVITEAAKTSHFRFGDIFEGFFDGLGLDGEPETTEDERQKWEFVRKVDVPCVSSGTT